jgi:acyl-CoA thioester hydrolase
MDGREEQAFRFEHTERVRWVDLDAVGVLNNAVYLTFLEQARFAYFGALGLLDGDRFPFLLGETRIRFLAPGRAGQTVRIGIRVSRLGTKSLDTDYEVQADGQPLARAIATLVWVDEGLSSRPIPEEARRRIEAYEGSLPRNPPDVFSDNSVRGRP